MEDNSNQQSSEKSGVGDFAYVTQVATPSGEASVTTLQEGSPVLAYSAKLESGRIILTASEAKVRSINTVYDPVVIGNMVYIYFEQNNNCLICSYNQPLLLSDGSYVIARNFQPGHCLVDKDGSPVTVAATVIAAYENGEIYSIATDMPITAGPDGHLLLCQGVIVGDFIFEADFPY